MLFLFIVVRVKHLDTTGRRRMCLYVYATDGLTILFWKEAERKQNTARGHFPPETLCQISVLRFVIRH